MKLTSIQCHYDASLNKWKVFVTGAPTARDAWEGFNTLRDMLNEFQIDTIIDIGNGILEIKEV